MRLRSVRRAARTATGALRPGLGDVDTHGSAAQERIVARQGALHALRGVEGDEAAARLLRVRVPNDAELRALRNKGPKGRDVVSATCGKSALGQCCAVATSGSRAHPAVGERLLEVRL